jgi:hypothetical protein
MHRFFRSVKLSHILNIVSFINQTVRLPTLVPLSIWTNFLPPSVFFLACLFMLAGMAEGSHYLLFNDYSTNLYQAGSLFTTLALLLSAFVSGRIHFFRMREEEEEKQAKNCS